jgi:hypothetical protein
MGRGIVRTLAALAVALAGVTASVAVSGNASAAQAGAAPARAQLPPADDQLGGVACPSTSHCIAVGANFATEAPLAETWTTLGWRKIAVKLPAGVKGAELNAVTCPAVKSGVFCVAVGDYLTATGAPFALTHIWNGTTWTPAKASSTSGTWLSSVSCLSATNCLAVGGHETISGTGAPIADAWNGKAWTSTPVTPPGGGKATLFDAVTCRSASFCMAVGLGGPYGQSAGTGLSGFWNGKTWRLVAAK